jgi:ABC-type branched-subunit amino acid transport system ATPase component
MTLVAQGITVRYGGIAAVLNAAVSVASRETVALIGPNGCGKTSLLRAVVGLVPATGEVWLSGTAIHYLPAFERVRRGVVYTPERARVVEELTVWENVAAGGDPDAALRRFPWLVSQRHRRAGSLSGGERQLVVLARALASNSQVLLLDEPLLGLDDEARRLVLATIQEVADGGAGVILTEHNHEVAEQVASRVYVMQGGTIVDEGTWAELGQTGKLQALLTE